MTMRIARSGIVPVEFVDESNQIAAAKASIERINSRARKQVTECAVAVEVDTGRARPECCAEGRRTGVREVDAHFEACRELHYTCQVQNMREVRGERTRILHPIVEIESDAAGCSGGPGGA